MDPNLKPFIGEHTEKAVGKALSNVSGDLTKGIGKTFGDLWFLVCGDISKAADLKRLKIARELEVFKEEVEYKIKAIPPEKLIEPKFQTIGPALEKAKFCVEEPELRSMFACLIESAMNSDKASKVQPCFVSIIEQMTPLDAQNISLFKHEGRFPIANFEYRTEHGRRPAFDNVFISNPQNLDIVEKSVSINNLDRLGLVSINFNGHLLPEELYDSFKETPLFKAIVEEAKSETKVAEGVVSADIEKGFVSITPLGSDFLSVCLQ